MKGTLVEYSGEGPLPAAGSYWNQEGVWYCVTPNGAYGCLKNHVVFEHGDGSISVTPSILVTAILDGGEKQIWHGYLTNGEWREC